MFPTLSVFRPPARPPSAGNTAGGQNVFITTDQSLIVRTLDFATSFDALLNERSVLSVEFQYVGRSNGLATNYAI